MATSNKTAVEINTGATKPLDYTWTASTSVGRRLKEIRIKVGPPVAVDGNLKIWVDSVRGTVYDRRLRFQGMKGRGDVAWTEATDGQAFLEIGDALRIQWPNTSAQTYSIWIAYEKET